jgi:hypothetical protein
VPEYNTHTIYTIHVGCAYGLGPAAACTAGPTATVRGTVRCCDWRIEAGGGSRSGLCAVCGAAHSAPLLCALLRTAPRCRHSTVQLPAATDGLKQGERAGPDRMEPA